MSERGETLSCTCHCNSGILYDLEGGEHRAMKTQNSVAVHTKDVCSSTMETLLAFSLVPWRKLKNKQQFAVPSSLTSPSDSHSQMEIGWF